MELTEYVDTATRYLNGDGWIIQAFIVVFLTLLADWIQKRLLVRLQEKLEKTRSFWDDAVIDAVRRPLTVLIWILGLTFAADILNEEADAAIFRVMEPLREVGVIAVLAWFLIRLIQRAEDNIIRHKLAAGEPVDRTTADAIAKLLRISVIITALLVVLQTLGYSITGVLAFGGVGGVVVGFAARDLLANFLGGLMVYLDRPFEIGDWIRSPDRDIEGHVEKIGWRLTHIRTFDKRPLYIPNAVFNNISVENPSRMRNRRIYETVGIRYDDAGKMAAIVADVKQMLRDHPEIDQDQTMIVNFTEFAASSLDFFIYTFTRTTSWVEYHEIKQDVLLKIIEIIESHGAECAFPTSTLHIASGPPSPEPG